MGLTAAKAAYQYSDPWLDELRDYLQDNFDLLRRFLRERLPSLRLVEPEGTYLAWLDFSGLGLNDSEINELIVHKARLWLDAGTMFGAGGEGFQRINIACPRSVLLQALAQLEQAIGTI